jgi:hypothetical protein
LALEGEEPRHYKPYYDADSGSKEELVALCDVCQSMHMVMSLGKGFPPGNFISSELNPAELICTCKGYKVSSNCSHTIAVTALFITDAQCVSGWKSFDRGYLETLLEKVARRTRAVHRPRNIVAGTRIQPTDDTVEEEGDGEESEDEDLDDM